jgi:hypothetical protein
MEQAIENIFLNKNFNALSATEKKQIAEYCQNEDEFMSLRMIILHMNHQKEEIYIPKPETKRSLDDLFESTFSRTPQPYFWNKWFLAIFPQDRPIWKMPVVQLAAVAAVAVVTIHFWPSNGLKQEARGLAKLQHHESKELPDSLPHKPIPPSEVTSTPAGNEKTQTLVNETEDFGGMRSASDEDLYVASNMTAGTETSSMAAYESNISEDLLLKAQGESNVESVGFAAADHVEVLDLLTVTF